MGVVIAVVVALVVLGAVAFVLWRMGRLPFGKSAGSFEGMYTSAFETSSFVPCGSRDSRYWIVWRADSDFAAAFDEHNLGLQGGELYVRLQGKLETGNPNGYGHLGQYNGQLTVTKLEEMSRERTC
jgi:hypothetical protein